MVSETGPDGASSRNDGGITLFAWASAAIAALPSAVASGLVVLLEADPCDGASPQPPNTVSSTALLKSAVMRLPVPDFMAAPCCKLHKPRHCPLHSVVRQARAERG